MSSSKRKSGGGDANVRRAKSSRSLETPAKLQEYPWIGQITELLPGSIPFACCHLYFEHWGSYSNVLCQHLSLIKFQVRVQSRGHGARGVAEPRVSHGGRRLCSLGFMWNLADCVVRLLNPEMMPSGCQVGLCPLD